MKGHVQVNMLVIVKILSMTHCSTTYSQLSQHLVFLVGTVVLQSEKVHAVMHRY